MAEIKTLEDLVALQRETVRDLKSQIVQRCAWLSKMVSEDTTEDPRDITLLGELVSDLHHAIGHMLAIRDRTKEQAHGS